MDSTEQSFEPSLERVISSTSLDRAFVLSCSESLSQTVTSDTDITTDKSLSGEFAKNRRKRSSVLDTNEQSVYSETCSVHSDSVDESCSQDSAVASDTEDSLEKVKEPSLSQILLHMIDTILRNGSKKTENSKKVTTSDSSLDPSQVELDTNSICCSDQITTSSFVSPSVQTERFFDTTSNSEGCSRTKPTGLELHTILEGSHESVSKMSNADSENWSRMYVGKLNSVTPCVSVEIGDVTYETREEEQWSQTEIMDTIPDITSSGVETNQSFETFDDYHDTIDTSFQLSVEETCPSEYSSASELSITEDRSKPRMDSTFNNTSTLSRCSNTQSITSRISEKLRKIRFSFARNSDFTECESSKNYKTISKPSKSHRKEAKSKKRLSGSLPDINSVLVTSCDMSGKADESCTPIRRSKCYSPQRTPRSAQSARKIVITRNRNWTGNSPRLSTWNSPAVVTSPIKPVKFLRNFFSELELKHRGLNHPRSPKVRMKKRMATPKIFITPASPLEL